MLDIILLTQKGYEKKKKELDYLVTVKRREMLERIKECQDKGDIEEEGGNTEFEEAKREQAWVESRIEELRKILAVSEILDPAKIPLEKIGIGSVAHLEDLDTGQTRLCQIVSAVEADPAVNKISLESPVGTALLDKSKGETVDVKTPSGIKRYKIRKITAHFPRPTKPESQPTTKKVSKPKPKPAKRKAKAK